MGHSSYDPVEQGPAWNAGKKLGAKRPLKPKEIWEIRFMLDRERRLRDRALFDLAIDSKLRGCDLVKVRIGDLVSGGRVRNRAMVIQQKTKRPVQFELLEPARSSLLAWLERRGGSLENYAFPSRVDRLDHLSTRQYSRLVEEWVSGIGLRKEDYGTHSLRRTKAALSTSKLAICEQCRFCLGTRRSRPLSGTLEWRLKTRSPWLRPLKCDDRVGAHLAWAPTSFGRPRTIRFWLRSARCRQLGLRRLEACIDSALGRLLPFTG
jgi:hypothetical protein